MMASTIAMIIFTTSKIKQFCLYSQSQVDSELFFRFDPRQEVQIKLSVAAEGFISSLAKLTMRLVSMRSLTL
jgi:glucose-6-phosphate 1-dehydrogenase